VEEVESEQPQTSQPQTTKSTLAPKVVHQVVIDDDDEEVEVVSEQKSLKCPFTQMRMKKAIKDSVCGHSFDHDAIMNYVAHCVKKRRVARCPYTNCNNKIISSNLVADVESQRLIDGGK